MIARGQNFKSFPLNITGSSTFGRYPKISIEKTYNMFNSDGWTVPYAGYQTSIANLGSQGRAIHTSTKLNRLVAVIDDIVYLINIFFDQNNQMNFDTQVIPIGTLNTSSGIVYIAENNKPQLLISDGINLYIYDQTLSPNFQVITVNFTPGYIDFHDTYFLCAASQDNNYTPPANNSWRLSASNDGTSWPSDAAHLGLLQTKSDNVQAVVRFPSRGNLIYVMGNTVSEPWFDVGYQLFPYQRSNNNSVDYGCINPSTIASLDNMVVWLAQNEKSGPIIMFSTGGDPEKITTDGIDYLFSQLNNPSDSQGFLYRQDGHLFYHINFYTDNFSLFYDFNTKKFYHACDENLNYFIAAQVAFFNNQYYFVTKNNGKIYAFDTIFTTYDGAEIPRIRTCRNVRDISQEYYIANDVGFTIEQGDNNPISNGVQNATVLNGGQNYTTATISFIGGNGLNASATATISGGKIVSISITNPGQNYTYPPLIIITGNGTGATAVCTLTGTSTRVDLSISIDGGESFSSDFPYILNPQAQRRNKLLWWQIGLCNDLVCQFKFWGFGRFVASDGVVNIRQ